MASRLLSVVWLTAFAAAGCASTIQAEPEYEAGPPPLRIEDQSANAPPPPPPTAPPKDAESPAPLRPTAAPPPSAALAAPEAPTAGAPSGPPPMAPEAPPSSSSWTQEYPTGRWVFANGYGWMWVPANAATADNDGVPYAYMYTPTYGWTWYISPWGPGPYRYGGWVRRPYHPVGWRGGWAAHPRVVVRLGGPGPRYYHSRGRGGGRHRH
ncbi:MAG: hypothetical protein ABIQ16_03430 [Polyangiaceae bacterium]